MRCLLVFLFLLLFLFPANAQDCKLKKEKDPYTREMKISSGFIQLEGGMISIVATKTEIDFMISLGAGKCLDDGAAINIFFDSSKLKSVYKNSGTMNCDGLFHFNFKNTANTPTNLNNLSTKKLRLIVFKEKPDMEVSSKSKKEKPKESEITFTPEQQQQFMDMVTCVIKESKTLQ